MREHDDLTITLLRLQMFGDVLGRKAVQLQELLPSLAGTVLGTEYVKVCPHAASHAAHMICDISLSWEVRSLA